MARITGLKGNATSFLPGQTTSFASLLDREIEVLLCYYYSAPRDVGIINQCDSPPI